MRASRSGASERRQDAMVRVDEAVRLSCGSRSSPKRRTPSRWRLRPPPPQAFRLALRLPRTTRRRGFNLEALRTRCSANLRHGTLWHKAPPTENPAKSAKKSSTPHAERRVRQVTRRSSSGKTMLARRSTPGPLTSQSTRRHVCDSSHRARTRAGHGRGVPRRRRSRPWRPRPLRRSWDREDRALGGRARGGESGASVAC